MSGFSYDAFKGNKSQRKRNLSQNITYRGKVKIAPRERNYKTEESHTLRKHNYGCLRGKERWGDA